MKKTLFFILTALLQALIPTIGFGKLELAAPFTDNMVLQREQVVPVWGFDKPGNRVTVEFAGQTKSVVADAKGDWMVKLAPLKASGNEGVI